MTDKEKAIRWFDNIADECDKLTSGNVAHLRAQIKGIAIRSAEYLTKHSQEPAQEDLEQEIDRYWCSLFTNIKLKRNPDTQSRDIFIPEPPYNERGARIAYALCIDWKDERDCEGMTLTSGLIRGLAHHFAQWDREQMMKDAVEGYIEGDQRNQEDEPYDVYAVSDSLDTTKFKIGDKVKVIIIKE